MYLYMKWVESIDDSHFQFIKPSSLIAFNRFTLNVHNVHSVRTLRNKLTVRTMVSSYVQTCTAYVLHCRSSIPKMQVSAVYSVVRLTHDRNRNVFGVVKVKIKKLIINVNL